MVSSAFLNSSLESFNDSLSAQLPSSSIEASAMTVSRFVDVTNRALQNFGKAVVIGEISEIRTYSHLYFKLKDDSAAVECLMFASTLSKLNFTPTIGMKVVIVGKSSLYSKNGQFKLIVETMMLAGAGKIMEELLALKEKLKAQGVFNIIKRPIPKFVKRVGIITSKEGHVLHDMLTVLNKRNPGIEVVVYPCSVQGKDAPETIVKALNLAFSQNICDVYILGRGGGSFEDLLPFSDEKVVMTLINAPAPIISAVGHEPDVALSDFAADLRAPTPTAAADIVSAYTVDMIKSDLERFSITFSDLIYNRLDDLASTLDNLKLKLENVGPSHQLNLKLSNLDSIEEKLSRLILDKISFYKYKNEALFSRLAENDPNLRVNHFKLELSDLVKRLEVKVSDSLRQEENRVSDLLHALEQVPLHQDLTLKDKKIEAIQEKLIALNPLLVLKRGYSVTLNREGKSIKINKVICGEELETVIEGGKVYSKVSKVEKENI